MLEGDSFSNIMAQNNSNSTGNGMNAASFAATYGNRGLSMQNVESLRRMTVQQDNRQQPQNNQCGANQTSQPQQQHFPANPYLVMAQVPVQQAAAFANFVNGQQGMQQQPTNHQQQQQGNPNISQNQFASDEDSWAQLLQPTPLPPGYSHSSPSNLQQQRQQVHQQPTLSQGIQQQQTHAQYSSGSTNSMTDNSGNTNNVHQFDPTTMSFLQELMKNAASAALQQQQMVQQPQHHHDQRQRSNQGGYNSMGNHSSSSDNNSKNPSLNTANSMNNNNNAMMQQSFMQAMGGQITAGITPVDSSVGPVSRSDDNSNSNLNGEFKGVESWKQMWDSASKTMFQQQHQQLLKKAVARPDEKLTSTGTSSNRPVQPAKRKFADFEIAHPEQQPKKNHASPTFHPVDSFGSASLDDDDVGDVNDDFLDDITPTPLSEIRAREQNWNARQGQPQQQQASLSPSVVQSQSALQTSAAVMSATGQAIAQKQQAFILPSTMMPPTVLASTFTERQSTNPSRKKRQGAKASQSETPHQALQRITQERGYGSKIRIGADEAGYDAVPSPLQLASFGTEVVKAVHTSNPERLSELLSAGLSPNPCNQFRDSIVDLVCKRANEDIFQCLMDHNCELRVCDGFGRTPLHHCCWASEFSPEIAHAVLKTDLLQLFIEDKRGQTPMEYIRPSLADSWVEFLEDHKDELFPFGGSIPLLTNVKDNRPDGSLPDPLNALPVPLAAAVSSGQVTTEQLKSMDARAKAEYGQ